MALTNEQLTALRWVFGSPTPDSQIRLTVSRRKPPETSANNDSSLDDPTLDKTLQALNHEGVLDGLYASGDGTYHWWHRLRVTAGGLQALGEWPPTNLPVVAGPWMHGKTWGQRDKLVIEHAFDPGFPDHLYLFPEPTPFEAIPALTKYDVHLSLVTLIEGCLLSGIQANVNLWSCLAPTIRGRELMAQLYALGELPQADSNANTLDQAEMLLAKGYLAAAANVAGKALEARLKQLSLKHNMALVVQNGRQKGAQRLADELKNAGHIAKGRHKEVSAWLDIRNQGSHSGEEPDPRRVRFLIDGVRLLLDEQKV